MIDGFREEYYLFSYVSQSATHTKDHKAAGNRTYIRDTHNYNRIPLITAHLSNRHRPSCDGQGNIPHDTIGDNKHTYIIVPAQSNALGILSAESTSVYEQQNNELQTIMEVSM